MRKQQTTRFGKRLKAHRQVDNVRDGITWFADRSPSGVRSGVVIASHGPQGGISKDPAMVISQLLRRAYRPRVIAPVVVTGPDGTVLRTITFGPNGERIVTEAKA